jgi:O-antigen/teichoic acid export membrane protein
MGRLRIGPTQFLTVSNIASSAIGLFVSAFIARSLGPEQLGVIGVIGGVNGSIMGFVDVRVNDVAAKLFFERGRVRDDQQPSYRAGVLWLAIAGNGIVAIAMAAIAASIGNRLMGLFTTHPVVWWWLPLSALTISLAAVSGTLIASLRLSSAFYSLGWVRFVSQVVAAGVWVGVIRRAPTIGGGCGGGFTGALLPLVVSLVVFRAVWAPLVPLGRPLLSDAWQGFRANGAVFFHGNLLGYAKLLQRSADVLFVAYFAGDRETGIYKLARTLADGGLAVLQDALYQVHYPELLEAFSRGDAMTFRRCANHLVRVSSLITVVLVVGEAVGLPLFTRVFLGSRFAGITGPVMVLTMSFVFICGFYPWLWALFTATGNMRPFTLSVFTAVLVQYAVAVVLFRLFGATALAAMFAALTYYFWMVPTSMRAARALWPQFTLSRTPEWAS